MNIFSDVKTKFNARTQVSLVYYMSRCSKITQNVASMIFNHVHVEHTGMSECTKDLNRKPISRVEFQVPNITFLG
jgi:hypothetical protein